LFLQAHHTTDSQCASDLKSNSEKLKVIEQKIAEKTERLSRPTTFAGAKLLSRHEMDLEKAVTRDRDPAKVFDCLVTNKSVESVDPDHPINHLDQIWKDVLSSKPTCRRKKRKRGAAMITDDTASHEMSVGVDNCNVSEAAVTKCLNDTDVSVKSLTLENAESLSSDHSKQISKEIPSKSSTCRRRKRKWGSAPVNVAAAACNIAEKISDVNVFEKAVSDGLNHKGIASKSLTHENSESLSSDHSKEAKRTVEPVPVEVIERYRLSVEQIKQLPRFQNYDAGVPSPVWRSVISARCNIYISRLCYDVKCPSVCLSVTEVHWRIITNLGFKFR